MQGKFAQDVACLQTTIPFKKKKRIKQSFFVYSVFTETQSTCMARANRMPIMTMSVASDLDQWSTDGESDSQHFYSCENVN